MHRLLIVLISLLALACSPQPTAPADPPVAAAPAAGSTGAGGAPSAAPDAGDQAPDASAPSSTSSLPAGCQGPTIQPIACRFDNDCYDASSCTRDFCVDGLCGWQKLADNTPCDVSDHHDRCFDGACCPPEAIPGAGAPEGR